MVAASDDRAPAGRDLVAVELDQQPARSAPPPWRCGIGTAWSNRRQAKRCSILGSHSASSTQPAVQALPASRLPSKHSPTGSSTGRIATPHLDVVAALLRHGADPDLQSDPHETPRELA